MRNLGVIVLGLSAIPAFCGAAAVPPPSVVNLRCEYKVDPVGIDAAGPRLGWQLRSQARGVIQSAYQIQVARDPAALRAGRALWDTGRVSSDRQSHVAYSGPALESSRRYHWRVRVWDGAVGDRVERARLLGDGAPPPGRLEGALDRGGLGRGPEDLAAVPDAAAGVPPESDAPIGARLRDEPRPVRARDQRPARRRPALHARLDELREAPAVPDLRRDRPAARGRERDRRDARRRLVPRLPRLARASATSTAQRLALRCQLRIEYADGSVELVGTRRGLEGGDRADPDVRHLHGRELRRPARAARLERAGLRRPRLDAGAHRPSRRSGR